MRKIVANLARARDLRRVRRGVAGPAVRALKGGPGGDITTGGSPATVRWLLSEGLADELNLLLYPVVVDP